jgi:hypothetical protein
VHAIKPKVGHVENTDSGLDSCGDKSGDCGDRSVDDMRIEGVGVAAGTV